MLVELHPVIVRFLSDQYDDTCSTVFPLLSQLLSTVRVLVATLSCDILIESAVEKGETVISSPDG
jgi:hypothetical protein